MATTASSIAPSLALPVYVVGGAGNDTITTAGGKDVVYGDAIDGSGDGHDTIVTGAGNDFVNAGNGDNVIQAGHVGQHHHGRQREQRIRGGTATTHRVGNGQLHHHRVRRGRDPGRQRPNWVSSGEGNDRVVLGDGGNTVLAGDGADVVVTGAGSDSIHGGKGDDLILAGAGDDNVWGGQGNDVLVGGQGSDYVAGEDGRDLLFAGDVVDLLVPDSLDQLLNQLRLLQLAWNPSRMCCRRPGCRCRRPAPSLSSVWPGAGGGADGDGPDPGRRPGRPAVVGPTDWTGPSQ